MTWAQQWREESRQEGRRLTLCETLQRGLQARFGSTPDDLDQRLQDVSLAQLSTWLDRLFVADTLQAVFTDD
ncbi:MAG: hypothetical protein KTR31_17750 [Myxococcales bacterium]|nr:hypothetical protein [Myxococcales bacterium]